MNRGIIFSVFAGLWVSGAAVLAQDQESFRWRGRADGTDEIDIRGDRVRIRHLEAWAIQQQDYRFTTPLPQRDGLRLRLQQIAGRGRAMLVEEPSAWNDYTAKVRIEDDSPGADYYELALVWRSDPWNDWDTSDEWGDRFENRREGVFRWAGRVDIGADVEIHGDGHRVNDRGGSGTQERQALFLSSLPRRDAPVSLYKIDGRGYVMLVQPASSSRTERRDFSSPLLFR